MTTGDACDPENLNASYTPWQRKPEDWGHGGRLESFVVCGMGAPFRSALMSGIRQPSKRVSG